MSHRAPRRARPLLVGAVVGLLVCAGLAAPAAAHDSKPGVLSLVEVTPGELLIRFVPPIDSRGEVTELTVELPPGCVRRGDRVLCRDGLAGDLAVGGLRGDTMKILVSLERQGDERAEWILSAAAPRIRIDAAPPHTALPWIRIGIDHILGGLDHLAFVIGLLLVLELSLSRRLLLTITAFTIAHSLTLALAVLGLVQVSTAPVEACIAASVVLIAREATHREPTLIRRWPWLAAGGFGLIHGLGFAAALSEIGLPRASLAWSLLWFNVGVELGQLATVVAVVGLATLGRRVIGERWVVGSHVHRVACYLLGGLAAWWLVERVVELARGSG
ncbi:MAG: HupE/UreJ family protein [Myxococcota bacterium]|nr:HupE/UreJ family protein [Myxococcota bacterium]